MKITLQIIIIPYRVFIYIDEKPTYVVEETRKYVQKFSHLPELHTLIHILLE
jgi:hypothetical protein